MKLASLFVLAIGVTCVNPAFAAFKCVDEKGRTHFEDTMPEACVNSVTYELSRSGTVIRKIEPASVVGEERAAREKAAEVGKTSVDQKRRDAVLLDSYTSERDLDAARDRNLEILRNRLSAAHTNAQKAQAREQEVQRLVDAKGQKVSAVLASDLERAKSEHATAAATLARIEKDLETTQARFAADKARWVELQKGR